MFLCIQEGETKEWNDLLFWEKLIIMFLTIIETVRNIEKESNQIFFLLFYYLHINLYIYHS